MRRNHSSDIFGSLVNKTNIGPNQEFLMFVSHSSVAATVDSTSKSKTNTLNLIQRDDIKNAILNPPVLALPDPAAALQITTDASCKGIGAVLEQRYPNSEIKPLYFFSKKLNPSQSKYNA
ncbi:integrase catalytic domain-containing protein [Trichonephila inaurata madagascariensis]|uniref:Integrase catalytic domain-containing protein n=1 Tax=Trichonephila inaurata madagascariensis TaxID=2747483 RepID=A0A8X6Y9S3_9ARAC|nr:integrase catalytic domain-containing protein [Trichonephila inaurata madagascariensis]